VINAIFGPFPETKCRITKLRKLRILPKYIWEKTRNFRKKKRKPYIVYIFKFQTQQNYRESAANKTPTTQR
jgi:hypothetical protein